MNKYELSEAYMGGPTGEIHPTGKMRLGKGGGGGSSTTTQEIPQELKPLAEAYTTKAMGLSDQYDPYQGQRYADLTQPQTQGIDLISQRALGGSPIIGSAENALGQTITGGPNPYLDRMFDTAAQRVTDAYGRGTAAQTDAAFARSRNYGGSAYNETVGANEKALGDSLSGLAANMYGNAYESDQGRRLQAIGMAPQFGNMPYQDAAQLLNAGQILQDQSQNPMDFQYQQYQEAQNMPYKNLAAMSGVFGSNLGGVSKTQQSGGGK